MAIQSSDFVKWFRSVAPYIHKFRNQTFVIAVVGEALMEGKLNSLAQDMALIQSMGTRIVLVHGFRPQINEQLTVKHQDSQFIKGLRVTDSVALDCVLEAAGQLRYEIEAAFSQGLPNTPMAGARVRVLSGNFITARPVGIIDGVDFQHTGVVRKIDTEGLQSSLDQGALVLLSPLGFSPTGEAFNLTMEDLATHVACALKADKLIFLTEVLGIRQNPHDENSAIETEISLPRARHLLASMPSKEQAGSAAFYLKHCVTACEAGVERCHMIPYAIDGSLLLEIYVHDGMGTMVVDEKLESLREAGHEDVASIVQLIQPFEQDGTLVRRDRTEIERDITNYSVIAHDGVIFGCAALYPYAGEKTAEMAALTVAPSSQGLGDGERLLRHMEQRARQQGLESIFVLTTRTMHWFLKRGFIQVDASWLPLTRQRQYNFHRKSQVLMKKL